MIKVLNSYPGYKAVTKHESLMNKRSLSIKVHSDF